MENVLLKPKYIWFQQKESSWNQHVWYQPMLKQKNIGFVRKIILYLFEDAFCARADKENGDPEGATEILQEPKGYAGALGRTFFTMLFES